MNSKAKMRDMLVYLAVKYKGSFVKVYKSLQAREMTDDEILLSVIEGLNKNVLTMMDDNYPETMKKRNCPPIVLFYAGNVELLKNESLEEHILSDGTRVYSYSSDFEKGDVAESDFVIACENPDKLDEIMELMIIHEMTHRN